MNRLVDVLRGAAAYGNDLRGKGYLVELRIEEAGIRASVSEYGNTFEILAPWDQIETSRLNAIVAAIDEAKGDLSKL